jgi:hypothetical protein
MAARTMYPGGGEMAQGNGVYTWLFLDHACPFLAENWLNRHAGGDVSVILLHEEAGAALARQLCEHRPEIEKTLAVSDMPEALPALEKEPENSGPRVILAVDPDPVMLRYRAPLQMPALQPYYPLFRRLWLMGFREFELCHLGGSRVFRLDHLLDEVRNRHQGERCFVAGNGPSLNRIDMNRLRDEITFGSNRCYLGYEKWEFPFTYWGIYDSYQIQEYAEEYETRVPAHRLKFFPFEYLPFLNVDNGCPVPVTWPRKAPRQFTESPDKVYVGHTVTYMLMQIAAIMGCNPIILIGADHRYNLKKRYIFSKGLRRVRRAVTRSLRDTSVYDMVFAASEARLKARARAEGVPPTALWQADHARGETHFDARYTRGGRHRFLPPEPEESERDFVCARRWAQEKGVEILNATPGTALDVFEKADYDALFGHASETDEP